MTDTPPEITVRVRELLMQRSGEERLRMGARMFDLARAFVRSSLGDPRGTDQSPEMRVQLFLRVYGQDFDPLIRARIVEHLRRAKVAGPHKGCTDAVDEAVKAGAVYDE